MKIYISHSSNFDYEHELYTPIRNSSLINQHKFIFPHEENVVNSKDIIKDADLVIAEVSFPSTGQGIELGWADAFGKRILLLFKTGAKTSSSLKFLNTSKVEYKNSAELVSMLSEAL